MIRLNVLFPLRKIESSSLCLYFDRFHGSILSFLFSIADNDSYANERNNLLRTNLFSLNYFEQLPAIIQESIEHEKPDQTGIDECIQRYLQILAICKMSSLSLTQLCVNDLRQNFSLFAHYKLFDILEHKEKQEKKKT